MEDVEIVASEGDEAPENEAMIPEEESSTLNGMFVYKFPSAESGTDADENKLVLVGQAKMGKINERFTTVRYFEKVAYAVTFEQIDPFYVIDFSEPEQPVVQGELEVLGFSEYLHPVNKDNTILAAVGKLADENGRVLGMQVSLFDAHYR